MAHNLWLVVLTERKCPHKARSSGPEPLYITIIVHDIVYNNINNYFERDKKLFSYFEYSIYIANPA